MLVFDPKATKAGALQTLFDKQHGGPAKLFDIRGKQPQALEVARLLTDFTLSCAPGASLLDEPSLAVKSASALSEPNELQPAATGVSAQANDSSNDPPPFRPLLKQTDERAKPQVFAAMKAAADKGDALAQEELGEWLLVGVGSKPDYKQAFALLQKTAKQSRPNAQCLLAICWLNGFGVKRADEKKALQLFQQCAGNANCPLLDGPSKPLVPASLRPWLSLPA